MKTISGHEFGRDKNDICYPLRRALMMRSMLGCNPGKVLKVDEGLLYAILKGPDYRHGARSLGKVLEVLKVLLKVNLNYMIF